MAKLVFLGKDFGGRTYELQVEQTTVGRSGDNTLVIHHKSVSHHHCEILNYGTEVIVRDLNSTNGTYVDDARLRSQSGVRSGQIVRFGDVEARLELEEVREQSSEVTAIYEHARAVRDQRREKAKGPHDPKETLDTGAPEDDDTGTLILTPPLPPLTTPPPEPPAVRKPARRGWWIAAALILAGLLALLFFLFR